MKKPLLVQIKTGLEHLSSYDKQMEDFVSKKPNRIIDENDISKGVTLFTNLFCKLEVA